MTYTTVVAVALQVSQFSFKVIVQLAQDVPLVHDYLTEVTPKLKLMPLKCDLSVCVSVTRKHLLHFQTVREQTVLLN